MTITNKDLLEVFKDKTILLITDSDLDGVSSHIIGRHYLQPIVKEFNFEITNDRSFANLDYPTIQTNKYDYIIFVDTSPSLELYNQLLSSTKEIYIFDHHISGKYELGDIPNYYFDADRCGARIFFEELTALIRVKRVCVQFVELVDTYDRWQDQSLLWKDGKDLHNVLMASVNWFDKKLTDNERYSNFINTTLDKFMYAKTFNLTKTERMEADSGEMKERKALDFARKSMSFRKDTSGNKYIWFECPSKISFVANCFLKEYSGDIKYCVGYSTFDKNKKSISLRSIQEFDCSKLAELHGGGGHKNASGVDFTNNIEFFNKLQNGESHLI